MNHQSSTITYNYSGTNLIQYVQTAFEVVLLLFLAKHHLWSPCDWRRAHSKTNKKYTLPETNSSPLKMGLPKRKVVFQPTTFRCELLVSGRVILDTRDLIKLILCTFDQTSSPSAGKAKSKTTVASFRHSILKIFEVHARVPNLLEKGPLQMEASQTKQWLNVPG